MTEVSIRAADEADLDRLMKLAEDCPGAPHWAPTTWKQVLDSAMTKRKRNVLVAESAEKFLGFAVMGIAADEAEIESLAVDASTRRQGIGRRLCETQIGWAGVQGANKVFLEVRMSNDAARALYEALGFREAAVRRGYYREPTEDGLVMVREL